jgi:hypothetical protein
MFHPIYRVTRFEKLAPFCLRVHFDDGTAQPIDFRPVLNGEIYGPLADPSVFNEVTLDEVAHTLVWPNGADFDPAILHDWPEKSRALIELAKGWNTVRA